MDTKPMTTTLPELKPLFSSTPENYGTFEWYNEVEARSAERMLQWAKETFPQKEQAT